MLKWIKKMNDRKVLAYHHKINSKLLMKNVFKEIGLRKYIADSGNLVSLGNLFHKVSPAIENERKP